MANIRVTGQDADHAPRAIASLRRARLDSAESTMAGSRQAAERSIAKAAEREAYMRAIQDCLRAGGNPCSDIDMPFRPSAELWTN
jgi:hypothetical protein